MKPDPIPLPVLLSHVLLAFEEQYRHGAADLPPLAVLANILRVLHRDEAVDIKTLPAAARISSRAVRIATETLERDGWLVLEQVKRGLKTIALSETGQEFKLTGMTGLVAAESEWQARFGTEAVQELRAALIALVSQFDLELPHFPSGYGQGDTSIQGGSYVPSTLGPPKIPAHGEEWPVVPRIDTDSIQDLQLHALLSQVLCAFTIDYDSTAESPLAGLHTVLTYLRYVSDEGILLAEAKERGGVTGTGRSALERHLLVTVEAGVAYLTDHGKRVRDRYPKRVVEIEKEWRKAYGAQVVGQLRATLEQFDEALDAVVPNCPRVCDWLQRR